MCIRDSSMATVACPISAQEDLDNPNIVKVALARNGDALYLSLIHI